MEPYGITAAQFKVLIIMAQFDVDTPAELCRHLCIDSGSMTRMLDRLEQKNLLVRQRSEADRRQVRLVLTEEGQGLADQLPTIGAAAMNQLAGAITPQELQSLEHILKKYCSPPVTRSRCSAWVENERQNLAYGLEPGICVNGVGWLCQLPRADPGHQP
jgi:DNA-binding MarR family transcriptional regulator